MKCEYVPTALHPSKCNDPYATDGSVNSHVFFFLNFAFILGERCS